MSPSVCVFVVIGVGIVQSELDVTSRTSSSPSPALAGPLYAVTLKLELALKQTLTTTHSPHASTTPHLHPTQLNTPLRLLSPPSPQPPPLHQTSSLPPSASPKLMAAPILRASLRAPLASGTAGPSSAAFVLPCRKLVLEYCEVWGSNRGMRDFVASEAVRLAERYPGVEMVIKRVENRHPHLRGNYGTSGGRFRLLAWRSGSWESCLTEVVGGMGLAGKASLG